MKRNAKMTAALRERETESREIGKTIRASKGYARWAAWQEKRAYGHETRHMILAHALMRKIPYLACEKKCREDNRPSPSDISLALTEQGIALPIETIRAWLKGVEAVTASVAA